MGTSAFFHLAALVTIALAGSRISSAAGPDDRPPGNEGEPEIVFLDLAPAPAGAPAAALPEAPVPVPDIPAFVVSQPVVDITVETPTLDLPPLPTVERTGAAGAGTDGRSGAGGAGQGAGSGGRGGAGGGGGGDGAGTERAAIPLMVLVPPAAPEGAKGGTATLLLYVDATGRVTEVEVTVSSGDTDYDDELRLTAFDWQFRPAVHPQLGTVASVFEISFQF